MIIKIFVGLSAAIAGLVAGGLMLLLHAGVATVWVEGPDATFFVPVPIAAVDVALHFVPEEDLRDARKELERYRPVIVAALGELSRCPDATLVEVESDEDYVLVRKVGDDLKIKVRTGDGERIDVAVPLDGVQHVLSAVSGI